MTQGESLMRLQDIDLALARIQHDHGELPQRARIKAAQAAKRKVDSQLLHITGQRKDAEIEVSDLDERRASITAAIDRTQANLPGEGDYRAISDFESRLADLAKSLEKVDFASERAMERLVAIEGSERDCRQVAERIDGELSRLADSFRQATEEMMARARELKVERDRIAATIEPELLERYERAQRRFGGLGVETLHGNRPSACRVSLQPSAFADVRRQGPIGECPYCHRILITEEF